MSYSDLITRAYTHPTYWHAMGNATTELTVTYSYPDAPDEVQRLRFTYSRDRATLTLHSVDARGLVTMSTAVHPAVVERMTTANGMPLWQGIKMDAIRAFYGEN